MGRWLEHSVTAEIQAPVEQVWEVWSDLEAESRRVQPMQFGVARP